jgi:hypothetical protein
MVIGARASRPLKIVIHEAGETLALRLSGGTPALQLMQAVR